MTDFDMPDHFDFDLDCVFEWIAALTKKHGYAKAQRIARCQSEHRPDVSCICGSLNDPPMPQPGMAWVGSTPGANR